MDEQIKKQSDELTDLFEKLKDEVGSLNYYINKKTRSIDVILAIVKSIDSICERISIISVNLKGYYSAEETNEILGSNKTKNVD